MLEAYKDILAAAAGIAATSQMFSGLFICKDIYKAGSTTNFPSMPFIGGFVISILFLQHGILLQDSALGIVNFIGITINIGYLIFFILWSTPQGKADIYKKLGIGAGIIALLLGYVRVENPDVVAVRFGSILTAILLLLIGSPLLQIRTIIRTKNTDMIPFPMAASGFVVGVLWMLYGVASHQDFIFYQNLIFISLGLPQIILCLIYPRQKTKSA